MLSFAKLLAFLCLASLGFAQEAGGKLECKSKIAGPALDFEFRLLVETRFILPVKQFRGRSVDLRVELAIEPVSGTPGLPVRVRNRARYDGEVPEDAKGELVMARALSTGVGRYRATWVITDGQGRKCEGTRQFKASLSRKQRAVELSLAPGEVVDSLVNLVRPEPVDPRPHLRSPHRLKIFLCVDVFGRRNRRVRPSVFHLLPHFSALRQLIRTQNFNEFSVVTFSFEDQKILARQDYGSTFDFTMLGSIWDKLQPETVDVSQLMRGSELRFFESLLTDELLRSEPPDGVVFIGSDTHFGRSIRESTRDRIQRLDAEFAFLDVSRYAWVGSMGNVVRAAQGKEYRLHSPSDVAKAVDAFDANALTTRPQ